MADLTGLTIKDDYLRRVLEGNEYLVMDGAMGTQLQAKGLADVEPLSELLCLSHPADITAIHSAYVAAGAQVVTTNTFGANERKLAGHASVEEIFAAAVDCARASGACYVAADIGPTGALLEPLGTMGFAEAYDLFATQVKAAVNAHCDLILIETMADLREAKAALLAARELSSLPVFVSMTFGEDGRTFLGTPPDIAAEVLSSCGAHVVGLNCSLGPTELLPTAKTMAARVRCPLLVQPNAGLPRIEAGQTVYDITPQDFAAAMQDLKAAGASVVGGCCGTSPAFISELASNISPVDKPSARPYEPALVLASAQQAVVLPQDSADIAVVGERINPTGKPKLKAALRNGNLDYLVGEAVAQQEAGADILDVNVGLPELDEPTVLAAAVERLSSTVALPLVVDSSDPLAIEAAIRGYAGKPLINSVNGKQSSMDAVLPLAAKYGCAVIGLALDEEGIPPTAEGRFKVAERIVAEAERYGIPRQDVVIDCLVMAVATNQNEARQILNAITLVKERLGVRTILGVSNVSFGLPQRNLMNATFLATAFGAGLDLAILNPLSVRYQDTVASYRVLCAQDTGSVGYIDRYANATDPYEVPATSTSEVKTTSATTSTASDQDVIPVPPALSDAADQVHAMVHLVLTGRKVPMPEATLKLLENHDALDIINGVFVPTLDVVGEKFDKGAFFLPQLMASAEAVKAGFDVVREQMGNADVSSNAPTIAIATVQGDIHDVGKNIVKMLLENYGYNVVDLGRDVSPEEILATVKAQHIKLVGLSALMTTTVKAMKRTIELLHEQAPGVAVFVGGAVLTEDYAKKIGADYYGKDAAAAARIAEAFFAE